jgi:hypothetical protein
MNGVVALDSPRPPKHERGLSGGFGKQQNLPGIECGRLDHLTVTYCNTLDPGLIQYKGLPNIKM